MAGGLVMMREPAVAISCGSAHSRSRESISAQSAPTKPAASEATMGTAPQTAMGETALGQTTLTESTLRRANSSMIVTVPGSTGASDIALLVVRVASAVSCSHVTSTRQTWRSGAVIAGRRRAGSAKTCLVVMDIRAPGAGGERVVDGTS